MAVADVKRKRSQCVWAPDPLEGYVLGHVTDVGGNSLTVELVDTSKQVLPPYFSNSCCNPPLQ